ncbi:zinc transporter, ZIP family [Caloramator quimbayensis]|uniref:Zinc transporter, ZIP family n=1 Tax=Caloramator quimbayensis TaxID=1147123 RepID=A0A1T4WMK1_9CLOT|nr:ZIP family metal transporter [Caloramator quimbayensis]SKA78566.1 zinc transporter, ZIP family [Caloramator quimbayensis]
MNILSKFSPVILALFATLFTYSVTALGASLVFFFKDVNKKILNSMLGFSAGVMIAASFWSLLSPAIEMCKGSNESPVIPTALGFLLGGLFIYFTDISVNKITVFREKEENNKAWKRMFLLILAITLHNIPEGLAVGVAFGALKFQNSQSILVAAIALAVGIGIQNFPEGAAVSLPLRREGSSRFKSFMYGQASAIVEPIAGVIGAYLVTFIKAILPYALSFAAGAMIYVSAKELIPESQSEGNEGIISIVTLIGFAVMMVLDVALG